MHSMPNAIKYFRIIFLQRKGYTYMKKIHDVAFKRNCKAYEENIKRR